jgi:hypothetical protein
MGAALKLSAFCIGAWVGMIAAMSPEQKKLLPFAPAPDGTTIVNDRVLFRTEGARQVISVHGIVFAHYDVKDHAAEAYAMISLFESGYADQNDIARCFGYSTRTLRRYQQLVEVDGLAGLANPRGRPPVNPSDRHEERKLTERFSISKLKDSAIGSLPGGLEWMKGLSVGICAALIG